MFTNNDNYDLDNAQNKIDEARRLLNLQVQIKTLENTLIAKGLISELDLNAARQYVLQDDNLKQRLEQLKAAENKIQEYKVNPQKHLQDLLKAKMEGKIK